MGCAGDLESPGRRGDPVGDPAKPWLQGVQLDMDDNELKDGITAELPWGERVITG